MRRRLIRFLLYHLAGAGLPFILSGCGPVAQNDPVAQVSPPTYVGSTRCQSCHTQQAKDWQLSDHYHAMAHATDSTVLGDFNDINFTADGVTTRFFKKDGKFFLNTQGEDGRYHDYPVLYTFGIFPLQQYLIEFPGGRLQATRVSWDDREKKWFNQYPGQAIHPRDWLHWTGNGQNWNTMCASCHSTELRKNYDFVSDRYATTWKEINVGCETCHGPGSRHVEWANQKNPNPIQNAGLFYGKEANPEMQLNTCAPCHARKADIAAVPLQTTELMDDLIPQIISNEFYHADGQIDDEDYEYGSFAQSKMFHREVRCSNCHNPHSGKMLAAGNALCMSCHEPKYDKPEHHFHAVNTEGAQCINCHMPVKTYMGNDHRRDHSFRIPRPDQSVVFGTPNTCTGCHANKTNQWAAKAVEKWYGPARAYHFSDDLLPGSRLDKDSEPHLRKLLADTTQPAIARATAAYYLGSLVTPSSATVLTQALTDTKAMVRYYALRALENFPIDVWRSAATGLLTDRVRAVRIAAADLFHPYGIAQVPPEYQSSFKMADAENRQYLRYQTDFAVGNVMLADYEMQDNDHVNAIIHYVRGLKKDSLMNYARLNLSAAYSQAGNNEEALKTLTEALAVDAKNDRIHFNLALLYFEMGDPGRAAASFAEAVKLGSRNPGVYYNYGLLLQQMGKVEQAEAIWRKGYALQPDAVNINFVLASLYLQQNKIDLANVHAQVVFEQDPGNPQYAPLLARLGFFGN
ncbi:MAG: tetratricopeptide repeat protein [Cyclobacteriaceae bacterium]